MGTNSNFVIVAADDFSDTGALALAQSLRMAHARDAELHVVHVVTEQDLDAGEGDTRLEKQDSVLKTVPQALWDRIEQVGADVAGLAALNITVHVRLGIPTDSINTAAADYGADVIIVGTAGRKGVQRLILGSVAETLIKHAGCPVLVVRPKDYSHTRKSARPEAAVPGEDIHKQRPRPSHIYTSSQIITFRDSDTTGVR